MKTWTEKYHACKAPHGKILEKKFAGHEPGSTLWISSCSEIADTIKQLNTRSSLPELRKIIAGKNKHAVTCPLTTGLFFRIVANAAVESWQTGASIESITPFWNAIEEMDPMWSKIIEAEAFKKLVY
jgi:hypothetical protein